MYLGDPSLSLVDGSEAARNVYKGDRGGPDVSDLFLQSQQAQTAAKRPKNRKLPQQTNLLSQLLDQSLFGGGTLQSLWNGNGAAPILPSTGNTPLALPSINALMLLQLFSALFSQLPGLKAKF